MANYIALNAKYYKNDDYKKIMDHDFRLSKVDYLLKDSKYKNFAIEFEKFEDVKQKKEKVLKKKGTKEQSKENTLIEFVCALSNEETKKILNEKDGQLKLQNALKLTMEEISKKYGFTTLFCVFHGDEGHVKNGENINNFHAHLLFYNFDFKKEKSVLRNIKKDEWGKMQDLASKCFQSCGLNYVRGEKKETKEKDHLERRLFISTKKEAIKDIKNYVDNSTKNILENSQDNGIFGNKINEDLLTRNIQKEVLKALKFHVPSESEITQKKVIASNEFDILELRKDLTKVSSENTKLKNALKQQQEIIEKFEEVLNKKQEKDQEEITKKSMVIPKNSNISIDR